LNKALIGLSPTGQEKKGSGVPKPKILCLDIEWRPAKAYVWQPWKENILPEKIIEDGGLLCVGCKWVGETTVHVFSEWEHGHIEMLERTRDMIAESDAIITFNGDRFDLPKLEGEFILHNISLPPKVASIDLIKTVKKLGYFMNRLAFIAPFLGIGEKMGHEGMSLWIKVMAGDEAAQRKMTKYCQQDVRLTERLYYRIRPAIRNHPALHGVNCPTCGSSKSHSRGDRKTRLFTIQRLQCQGCGHWFDGVRKKI
jgi:hypothetical protein